LLIKKGNSNRVINDISKERTLNLFKLSKKWIIYLNIYEYRLEDELLKKRLEEFKIKEWDWWWKIFLVEGAYKEEENRPTYEYKHEWNYYLNDFLDDNFDLLKNNLNRWDDFNLICYTSFYTVWKIFIEITKVQENKSFNKQLNQFIKIIKDEIWDRENYNDVVVFSINIDDYIENKWFFYEIINKLYEKYIIEIKEIYIENRYFVFKLEKFNNFNKETINKIFN
jgi:hypothetical protein